MESNKNNNKNEGDEQQQQLPRSTQKRKLNELTSDEDKPAGEEEDQNYSSKKYREDGNDLQDLELENLSREELIKLVHKQMTTTMEAQKQLETSKKEAEEFSQRERNIQLEQQEKAELHADLYQKMAEIVDMHKEAEQKSKDISEKVNQLNALFTQLNESTSHQHQMPTEKEMKIQLSLETWFDWLGFVPRHRLGQIIPMIGDRRFASIVQKFLHEYGEISIDRIKIVAPYEEDPSGHPRVRALQNNRPLRFEMAEAQMPANITNFDKIELSYFDQSVLNFMQKFQQKGLLNNVNLSFARLPSKDLLPTVLCHILPLFNGIISIQVENSGSYLVDFYDDKNSLEIHERNMKMMEATSILTLKQRQYGGPLPINSAEYTITIDLYCRWLYQTARADGKPRVLNFERSNENSVPISLFIDRLKQDFQVATDPATFFIQIHLPKEAFPPLEEICLDNDKTKERFLTKMEETKGWKDLLLISRCPLGSINNLILGEEICQKKICLSEGFKVVPI